MYIEIHMQKLSNNMKDLTKYLIFDSMGRLMMNKIDQINVFEQQ